MMASTAWKKSILQKLELRDAIQVAPFTLLIEHYGNMLRSEKALTTENASLKQKLEDKSMMAEAGITLSEGSSAPTSSYVLYKKISELQDEIRTVSQQLAATKEEVAQKSAEIAQLQEKIAEAEKQLADKDEDLQNKMLTIKLLKEELQALQVVLVSNDEKMKELTREKTDLVNELMKKAQQNADMANQIKELQDRISFGAASLQSSTAPGSLTASTTSGDTPIPLQRPLPSKAKRIITQHAGEVNTVVFNAYGTTLASGGFDKVVRLWDSNQFVVKATLHGAIQSITACDFSNDDSMVLAASNDNAIRVWHQGTQRLRHTLNGHTSQVYGAVFNVDCNKIITGSQDRNIKVWDLARGFCIRTIFCYSACNTVAVSADGLIASGHHNSNIVFWDLRNGECIANLGGIHSGSITSVTFAPPHVGQYVLTNSRDHCLKLIDVRTHDVVQTYRCEQYRNGANWNKATFSPDGNFIAAGGNDGSIFIWERQSGKLQSTLRNGHKSTVSSVAWNPVNSAQIASCDKNGVIVFWD